MMAIDRIVLKDGQTNVESGINDLPNIETISDTDVFLIKSVDNSILGYISGTQLKAAISLPAGLENETLRHNGTSWVSNSILRIFDFGTLQEHPFGVEFINGNLLIRGLSYPDYDYNAIHIQFDNLGHYGNAAISVAAFNPYAYPVVKIQSTTDNSTFSYFQILSDASIYTSSLESKGNILCGVLNDGKIKPISIGNGLALNATTSELSLNDAIFWSNTTTNENETALNFNGIVDKKLNTIENNTYLLELNLIAKDIVNYYHAFYYIRLVVINQGNTLRILGDFPEINLIASDSNLSDISIRFGFEGNNLIPYVTGLNSTSIFWYLTAERFKKI
jgi:hypothetical protein